MASTRHIQAPIALGHEPHLERIDCCFGAISHSELAENFAHIVLDGLVRQEDLVDEGKPSGTKAAQLTDLGAGMAPRKVVATTVLTAELAKVVNPDIQNPDIQNTTVALSHMIFEGFLDRFPGIKIVAAHGGGFLASYIGRSDNCRDLQATGQRMQRKRDVSKHIE